MSNVGKPRLKQKLTRLSIRVYTIMLACQVWRPVCKFSAFLTNRYIDVTKAINGEKDQNGEGLQVLI